MAQGKAPQDFKGTASGGGNEYSITFTGPDWAKEATQAMIDKKLGSIDKKLNPSGGLGKMLKAALERNTKAIQALQGQQKKDNTNDDQHQANTKKHQNKTQKAEEALQKSTTSMDEGIAELIKLGQNNQGGGGDGGDALGMLRNLGGRISPLAMFGQMIMKTIKKLAGFVGAIASAAGAVALFIGKQLMKTFNLMNDSLSNGTAGLVGAYTDGSTNIATQASLAGLSLKEFTEALQETSEEIMVLGAEGYRDLRNATRDMAGGLFDMGYQNEEMTKLLGREISIRARLGMRLDAEGTNLSGNVVEVARTLRNVGKAAGIAEEELYERAKLEDETNTLIAARARELGDAGISELQTSIRKLSIKMVGLSPTYAGAITSPLVNAVITGAVGLDEGFTDLVTVFPGLVDSMDMAQSDIVNSGKITDSTINNIMESLMTTTNDEFDRARQLALMTRSQTAIQAVNFASEARARKALLNDLTSDGDRARNISLISAQADTFFDMMKAPFENAIMQFTMGILGVSTTGEGVNFGAVIKAFSIQVQDFVENLPLIGDLFQGTGFFARFNEAIDAYFTAGSGQDRADAAERLNNLITKTIDDISAKIGQDMKENNLGKIVSDFFRKLIDDITLSIYEATDGRFMKQQAGMAYIRQGRMNEAREMNDKGLFFGGGKGKGAKHGIEGFFQEILDTRNAGADQFGVTTDEFMKASGVTDETMDDFKEQMMDRYKMDAFTVETLVQAARENRTEIARYLKEFGLFEAVGGGNVTAAKLTELFKDNDPRINAFLQDYANNMKSTNETFTTYSRADFGNTQGYGGDDMGTLPGYSEVSGTLDSTIDKIKRDVGGADGLAAARSFRQSVINLAKDGQIDLTDGIQRSEIDAIKRDVDERLTSRFDKDTYGEDTAMQRSLLNALERLIVKIEDGSGAGAE